MFVAGAHYILAAALQTLIEFCSRFEMKLDDKYRLERGQVYLTGIQALVRLPMDQMRRDRRASLNTAAFISGYEGSPLGGYDLALSRVSPLLTEHRIHFVPGVNEDVAATSIFGSQISHVLGESKYDGVVGIWYGKGPGVDRSGDILRHANLAVGAGAAFGVAPGMNPRVVHAARDAGLPFAPGIATPSDIEQALECDCRLLKFFSAEPMGGISYLKSIAAPYAHLNLRYIPLGGIDASHLDRYLAEPLIQAIGGSWIAPRELIQKHDWQTIGERAREAAAKVRAFRPLVNA